MSDSIIASHPTALGDPDAAGRRQLAFIAMGGYNRAAEDPTAITVAVRLGFVTGRPYGCRECWRRRADY